MSDAFRFGFAALVSLAVALASAQTRPSDTIPAAGGNITITPINHATLQLTHGSHVIDIDPVAQGNYANLAAPGIILITDIHGDHLDPATVAKLKTATTTVVAPAAAAAKLPGAIVIANGEAKTVDGVTIEAVPMYNLTRGPGAGQLFHDKGRG